MAYSYETSSVKTINGEVSGLADVVARQAIANLPTLSGGEGIQIVNEDGKNRIDLGLSAGSNMSFVYDQETNTIRLDAEGGAGEVNLTMTYTAGTYTGLDYDTISSTIANNPGKRININLVKDYNSYGTISRDIDKFTLTNSSYYSFGANGTYNYYFTQGPSLNTNSSFNAKTIIASANTSNKGVRVLTGAFTGNKINMDYDVYTQTYTVTAINNSPISASSAGVALVAISALNGGGSGLNWSTDGTTYSGLVQDGTFNNKYGNFIAGRYDTDKVGVSVSSELSTSVSIDKNTTNLYVGGISNSSYHHQDAIRTTSSDFNISSVQLKDVITNAGLDTIKQATYDINGLHFSGYKDLNGNVSDNSAINLTFADIDYLQTHSGSFGRTYTGVSPIQVNNTTNEISISGEELSAGPGINIFESGGYVVISAGNDDYNFFPITGTDGTTNYTANCDCSSFYFTTAQSPAGGNTTINVKGVRYQAYPATDVSASWYNIINTTNNSSNCYCIRFKDDLTAADLANYSAYDKVTVVHSNEYTPDCMLYWDGNTKVFPSGLYCELVKGTNDQNQTDWFFTNSGWTNNLWWDWD